MPRLPAPEDYGLSAPRPSRSVTDVSPTRQSPDLLTGKVMGDLGLMMQQEAEKLDETVAMDALNKLQQKQLDLTYGDQGFTKIVGGDVVKRPITTEYADKIKAETEALAAGLSGNAARAKFQNAAAAANRGFTQKLFVHAAEQTDKYQTDTANARVTLGAEAAKAGDVMGGLAMAIPVVEGEVLRRGLSGDAATVFRQEALGVVHSSAIDGLIARGDPAAATLYLKTNSGAMSKKQTDHYDPILKAQNAYVGGKALAGEVAGMDDAAAQKYISEKAGADKALADSAYAELTHRKQATHAAAMEVKGSVISAFSQSPSRATAEKLYASPEFLAMPKLEQGNVREYFRHQIQAADDHARALSDRADAKARQRWDENPEALSLFGELSGPALGAMTSGAVMSYAPYLGPKLVAMLEDERRRRESGATHFEIPANAIMEALPTNLQKPTGDAEVGQVRAFKGVVARSLQEWKAQNKGMVPTPEEQYAIVRSATRDVQQSGMLWGTNTVKAYELKDMPDTFRTQARAAASARGKTLTEGQLIDLWAKQKDSR